MAVINRAGIENLFSNAVDFFQRASHGNTSADKTAIGQQTDDVDKYAKAIEDRLVLAQSDKSAVLSPAAARAAEKAMQAWMKQVGGQLEKSYKALRSQLKEQRSQVRSRITELKKNKEEFKQKLQKLTKEKSAKENKTNKVEYEKIAAEYKKVRQVNRENDKNLKSAKNSLQKIKKQLRTARKNYKNARNVSTCRKNLRKYYKEQMQSKEKSSAKSAAALAGITSNKIENAVDNKQKEKIAANVSSVDRSSSSVAVDAQNTKLKAPKQLGQKDADESKFGAFAPPKPDDHSHDLAKKDEMHDFQKGSKETSFGQEDFGQSILALSAEAKHSIVALGKELVAHGMKFLGDVKDGPGATKQQGISAPAVAAQSAKTQDASSRGRS